MDKNIEVDIKSKNVEDLTNFLQIIYLSNTYIVKEISF